jgi:hypothetical protein
LATDHLAASGALETTQSVYAADIPSIAAFKASFSNMAFASNTWLAAIVYLGSPGWVHPVLLMQRTTHTSYGNPADSRQIDVRYALHQRLDAQESKITWD